MKLLIAIYSKFLYIIGLRIKIPVLTLPTKYTISATEANSSNYPKWMLDDIKSQTYAKLQSDKKLLKKTTKKQSIIVEFETNWDIGQPILLKTGCTAQAVRYSHKPATQMTYLDGVLYFPTLWTNGDYVSLKRAIRLKKILND